VKKQGTRDVHGRLIHTCAVEGCNRTGHGKHCNVHAMRLRLHGDVGPAQIRRRIPSNTPPADRLDIIGWEVDADGCHIWRGRLDEYGYGRVDAIKGAPLRAHRVSYERANGVELTRDSYLLHSCDKPACINPEHLRAGTQRENIHDMWAKGRARPWGREQEAS